MGSGKSSQLIEDFISSKKRRAAVSVQLAKEIGTLGKVESRNGKFLPSLNINSKLPDDSISYLAKIFDVGDLEEIYIDEIQFLSSKSVKMIIELSEEKHVDVRFYGLETTFLNDYFESSKYLLEVVKKENIKRIDMMCQKENCNLIASHNARISRGKVSKAGELFVSEKNTYLSLCSDHYFE